MPLLMPSKKLESEPPATLQMLYDGNLSVFPHGALERVAQATDVPVSSLATLVVNNSSCTNAVGYNAVVQYAALSAPPRAGRHHPLVMNSFEIPEESDDEDDDASSDDVPMPLSVRVGRLARIAAVRHKMTREQGLRQQRSRVPQFKFSLGETSVVWPPPPHLQAAALVEERESRRKRRKVAEKLGANGSVSETLEMDEMDDDSQTGAKGKEAKVIHLVHYAIGGPQVTDMEKIIMCREVLMVSPEGPEVLRRFLEEIIKWAKDKDFCDGAGRKFALHRYKMDRHGGGWWHSEGMKRARPVTSVILPKGQLNAIMNDVRNFIKPETKKWYISHGLQHRRAYLFYGPPGTGKTSTIRALASTFRLNCCFLSMTNVNFSNQILCDALNEIPDKALIVLEDVDALFNEDRKNDQAASLTFSGLLNALDGLVSTDGVITVMTTNHIERLDKALIRGGRVDRRFLFNKPSVEQLKDLFLSFYPQAKEDIVCRFLERVNEGPEGDEARSIATLQQLFIDQRENSAEKCVDAIPRFYEAHFPDGTNPKRNHIYT